MFLIVAILAAMLVPSGTCAFSLHGERSVQGSLVLSGTIQPTTVAEIDIEDDEGETVIVRAATIDAMHTPWVRHDEAMYRVAKGDSITVALHNGLHAWREGVAVARLDP
jgi:hypothetical protein